MRTSFAAALAGLAVCAMAGSAAADEASDAKVLGDCLIGHSSPESERLMKSVLINALQDNSEALNSTLLQWSLGLMATAQANCGLKLSDLEKPFFEKAVGIYGEFLGQKIFGDALGKLGK